MMNFLVHIWAKWSYVFRKEGEAHMHELSARVADAKAQETRDEITQLTKDADEMDARIKQMAEMEEKGFWECEDGHESDQLIAIGEAFSGCPVCKKPAKLVSRATMSGQEKYESDKDRADAEKLVAARREAIVAKQGDLENQEQTAQYFRVQAQGSRQLAEALRRV
jgi:hypothetical protein